MDIATGNDSETDVCWSLKKGIDFEIDKDNGSVKIIEKNRTTKCCPSPKLAINRFGVYAAP